MDNHMETTDHVTVKTSKEEQWDCFVAHSFSWQVVFFFSLLTTIRWKRTGEMGNHSIVEALYQRTRSG